MVSLRSDLAGMKRLGWGLLLLLAPLLPLRADPALDNFFRAQTNVLTWTADFTQTRTLRTLSQPLVTQGKIWFAAPHAFRWELGQPAQTIALRQTNAMLLIYPALQRVEKYSLDRAKTAGWSDMLSVLEAGFPRTPEELQSKFEIRASTNTGPRLELVLAPKSAAARRLVKEIRVVLATDTQTLAASELRFADGSTLRNDFTNAVRNGPLADEIFRPTLDPAYKVVEMFK